MTEWILYFHNHIRATIINNKSRKGRQIQDQNAWRKILVGLSAVILNANVDSVSVLRPEFIYSQIEKRKQKHSFLPLILPIQ